VANPPLCIFATHVKISERCSGEMPRLSTLFGYARFGTRILFRRSTCQVVMYRDKALGEAAQCIKYDL